MTTPTIDSTKYNGCSPKTIRCSPKTIRCSPRCSPKTIETSPLNNHLILLLFILIVKIVFQLARRLYNICEYGSLLTVKRGYESKTSPHNDTTRKYNRCNSCVLFQYIFQDSICFRSTFYSKLACNKCIWSGILKARSFETILRNLLLCFGIYDISETFAYKVV